MSVEQIARTFTIVIRGEAGAYTVEANGPLGVQVDAQPFQPPELSEEDKATLKALASGEEVLPDAIRRLGQSLYRAIFTIPAIAIALGRVQGSGGAGGVRLRLQVEPLELAALPLEAMHDGQDWLAFQSSAPLVRRLALSRPRPKIEVQEALRILFAFASPENMPLLDVEQTAKSLQELLRDQREKGQIVLDVLPNVTLDELDRQLVQDYHILYFAGHGSPDAIYLDDGQGALSSEGRRQPGRRQKLSAEKLAQLLEGKRTRLVFLSACNTGAVQAGESGLLGSFTQELAKHAPLSAIVGMQYMLGNPQAEKLATKFFVTLAAFRPVDVALAEARKALTPGGQVGRDAIAPVMYLQAEDGALFQQARGEERREKDQAPSAPGAISAPARGKRTLSIPYKSARDADAQGRNDAGAACIAMILAALGKPVSTDQVSAATGVADGFPMALSNLSRAANTFGLPLTRRRPNTLENLRELIDQGIPPIALVNYAYLPDRQNPNARGGHWVLVVGYDAEARRVFIHDPLYWGPRREEGAYHAYDEATWNEAWGRAHEDGNTDYLLLVPDLSAQLEAQKARRQVCSRLAYDGKSDYEGVPCEQLDDATIAQLAAQMGEWPAAVDEYIVQAGEGKAAISKNMYGDPALWGVLQHYNGQPISYEPQAGEVLKVPRPAAYVQPAATRWGGLKVRPERDANSPTLEQLPANAEVVLLSVLLTADGEAWTNQPGDIWVRVRTPAGVEGWARYRYAKENEIYLSGKAPDVGG